MKDTCDAPAEQAIDLKGMYPSRHWRCSYLFKQTGLSIPSARNAEAEIKAQFGIRTSPSPIASSPL